MERIKLDIQRFAANTIEIQLKAATESAIQVLKQADKELSVFKAGVNAAGAGINKFKSNIRSLSSALNSLNLSGLSRKFANLGNSLYRDFLTKAVDTSEELNLFNVVFNNIERNGKTTFSELGKRATRFQNELNEAFGTNKKETMRYQGLFQAMGESAGLSDTVANLMSENMTKLAYDLASLYNTTETKAAESLRAGVYAGQTKPLRNYGIDVTQTSFKPLMEELKIEKSVNELTQGEKEILRYISTLRQAKNAMGDFANTIESPANQLKVLSQQFYEMQAAIGNLFVGAFARILPYVNAIIMVIKELAKTIASIFGIRMKDYNSGIATYEDGLEDYSEGLGGIADSADSAGNSIKALKRQVLGFDQINNLTSPTPSSGGSSGGGGGGGLAGAIDQKLLDALEGYSNGMEKVRMKAIDIRDRIMEWLGFQKQINEETHETYFTYDTVGKTIVDIAREISTNLGNMLNYYTNKIDWAKLGEYLAIGLNTAFTFIDTFIQTYDWRNLGNKIANFFNKAIQDTDFGVIGRVLTDKLRISILSFTGFVEKFDFKQFATKLAELINNAIKNIPVDELISGINALVNGIWETIKILIKEIDWGNLIDSIMKMLKDLDWKGKLLILAPVLAAAFKSLLGSKIIQEVIAQMILKAVLKGITGSKAAGALSSAGTTAAGAGTTAAGSSALSTLGYTGVAAVGIYLDIKGYETSNNVIDNLFSGKPIATNIVTEDDNWFTSATKGLGVTNLLANPAGKSLIQQQVMKSAFGSIKNNGIEGTLKNMFGSVESAFGLDEGKLYNLYTKPFQKIIGIIDKTNAELFGFGKTTYRVADDIKINAKKYYDVMVDTNKQQRIMKAAAEGNYEEIERIIKETSDQSAEHVKNSLVEQTKTVKDNLGPELLNQWGILAFSSREKYKEGIKNLPVDLQDKIQAATGVIVSVTPSVVQHFINLGNQSETKLVEELKKLPPDVQKEVVDKMKEKGAKIPDEVQQGINSKPKPKVDVTTSSKKEVQDKLGYAISGVTGSIAVGISLPSSWSIQDTLNTVLSSVTGGLNVLFSKKADGGVFANGHWQPIQAYANGGVPAGGQLFMAREAGPELVGKIGRHTAVMNNNQIVDSVKAGVYEAVSAAMSEGGMGAVQIDLHTDEGVVVDRINKVTRQTGVCPINI